MSKGAVLQVNSAAEAESILLAFPAEVEQQLLTLAEYASRDPAFCHPDPLLSLPEGWRYLVCHNCIVARYGTDTQQREPIFVPQVFIEFREEAPPQLKKSIVAFPALGYCSCGKRMRLVQGLLWAVDMIERYNVRYHPMWLLGKVTIVALSLWATIRPMHQYSIAYSRHVSCL